MTNEGLHFCKSVFCDQKTHIKQFLVRSAPTEGQDLHFKSFIQMKDNLKSLQMDSYPFLPKPEAPIPRN